MTLSDLTTTINFRGLFEFEFGEAAYRQYRALDVVLLADLEIEFLNNDDTSRTGRFVCQTEVLGEEHGTASGTFILNLPDGLTSNDAVAILENAALEIVIATAPFAANVRIVS